jgi:hypothetical protein
MNIHNKRIADSASRRDFVGGSDAPKHASWLNMVEIEIGVLRCQCLDRRIDNPQHLRSEIAAWDRHRNTSRARIKWMFTTAKARTKIGRAYPNSQPKSQNHCDEVLATNAR